MKNLSRRLLQPLRYCPAFFLSIRNTFHPSSAIYRHLYFHGRFVVKVFDRGSPRRAMKSDSNVSALQSRSSIPSQLRPNPAVRGRGATV